MSVNTSVIQFFCKTNEKINKHCFILSHILRVHINKDMSFEKICNTEAGHQLNKVLIVESSEQGNSSLDPVLLKLVCW